MKGVEDRYYTDEEYAKLTKAQQDWLRDTRAARGHKRGNRGGAQNKNKRQKVSKTQFNKLKRKVAALTKTKEESDKEDDSNENENKGAGNRNHKALTRKK